LDVTPLISAFAQLDGIVEMPASRRFIVITVLIRAASLPSRPRPLRAVVR